jgi:hypothetical protein
MRALLPLPLSPSAQVWLDLGKQLALDGIKVPRRVVDGLPGPPYEPCPEVSKRIADALGKLGGLRAGLSYEAKAFIDKAMGSIRIATEVEPTLDAHEYRHERWMSVAGQPVYICGPCGHRIVFRDGEWIPEPIPGTTWIVAAGGWVKLPNAHRPRFTILPEPAP